MSIDLRPCAEREVPELMDFIERFWRPGHVLARSRELMDWQHRADDGRYTWVLAWEGGALMGVLGYVPSRRYDADLSADNVLWLALWKVRDDAPKGLGLKLLRAVQALEPHAAIAVNGINHDHPPMYRALRYEVVELRQFYAVDPDREPALVGNPQRLELPRLAPGVARLCELGRDDLDAVEVPVDNVPRKSGRYFAGRFLAHPFYRYRVHAIEALGTGAALVATRVAEHDGRRALRIVDFAGDALALASAGSALLELVRESDAEYVDFCQHGIPEAVLAGAGLRPVDPDGPVVVPTYFEPFVPKAGRILSAFQSKTPAKFRIFRADGDQDRPNQLRGPHLPVDRDPLPESP